MAIAIVAICLGLLLYLSQPGPVTGMILIVLAAFSGEIAEVWDRWFPTRGLVDELDIDEDAD